MNIDVTRGQVLYMVWSLPYDNPISDTVYLDLSGAELSFSRGGMVVESLTISQDEQRFVLIHTPDGWGLKYASTTYDYLLDGESTYELTVVNTAGDAVIYQDEGTVTVHG